MRAIAIIIGLAAGLAGIAPASAADLAVEPGIGVVAVQRAAPVVICDTEPGITVRAYWRAPWRHRHYFPFDGRRPHVGRLEHVVHARGLKPAESYSRVWTTSPYGVDRPLPPGRFVPSPRPEMEPPFR